MIKNTGRPAYLQIADDLRSQIIGGSLAPGDPLPSISKLAGEQGVSESVVKSAVRVLRTEGLVIGQQGKAVFVRDLTEDEPPDTGSGDDPLIAQLSEIQSAVQRLGERLSLLEDAVYQEPRPTRRSGE